MKKTVTLTQERLFSLYEYRDGLLYLKVNIRKRKIGEVGGSINKPKDGNRRRIMVDYKVYPLSRLIFFYHHGWWPKIVDHIDGNQLNDRIENLRAASISQNGRNRKSAKKSSSKYLGVSSAGDKWQAKICDSGNKTYLGIYNTEEEAAIAYNEAAIKIHKEFANLNIIQPCVLQ